jgi:DNA polymerase-3 subunit epsilon
MVVLHDGFSADFETANTSPESACAVGIARVEGTRIVSADARLLKPPSREFSFTHVHGITWPLVAAQPSFREYWPELRSKLSSLDFVAAHNASFDRGVLASSCRHARLSYPGYPFLCTMELARNLWGIYPTKLPDVCGRLGIPLKHHDALSDARACAEIVLAAFKTGWRPSLQLS